MRILSRLWRIVATGFGFFVFAMGAFALGSALLLLLPLPMTALRKRRWARAAIRVAAWLYLQLLCALGLLRINIRNRKGLCCQGELVVANHPSLLDAVLLLSLMPGPCFLVKAPLLRNPFTAAVVRLAGYLPNSGEGKALVREAAKVIGSGESLVIFPEGTRTEDPSRLQLRRGAANIALTARCPIRPVRIRVVPMTLRKHEPWYAVPDLQPRFSLDVLDPINPVELVDTQAPISVQARQLNRQLKQLLTG